ncbi:gp53-like domain-containing protein [Burkholderia glumae]
MAKLVESSQWEEDLYQIETSDPVEGGPDGVSNRQAKQLGGRTRFLRQQVGDDPNFATTIANALSSKAPIDSPVFTGTPTRPTPPQFDNSSNLATTAFVQRAGGNLRGTYTTSSSGTLGAAQAGMQVYVFKGGTTQTINFDELVDGTRMVVYANYTEAAQTTLKIKGAAKFIAIANSLPDALTLNQGEALSFVVDKSNINIEVPTANLRYSTALRARFGPVGFQELPSGLIIQWGVQNLTSGNADMVVFPIAFPKDCMRIVAVDVYAACNPCAATPNGKTSFVAYGRSMGSAAYAPTTLQYIALGY